jgi:2-oxoglutarate ferredoxin oxidoreductase subunit gamma
MTDKIFIAGAGGQGILALGKILAEAACSEWRHVTYYPSYGAEIRGGTANCSVIISDSNIGSPTINSATTLIILNAPSYLKFIKKLAPGGLLIINSSLVETDSSVPKDAEVAAVPATGIATDAGDVRCANVSMLGAYLKRRKTVGMDTVKTVIKNMFGRKPAVAELNLRILMEK